MRNSGQKMMKYGKKYRKKSMFYNFFLINDQEIEKFTLTI